MQQEHHLAEALALGALLRAVCNRLDAPVESGEIDYLRRKLGPMLDRRASSGLGAGPDALSAELASLRDLM